MRTLFIFLLFLASPALANNSPLRIGNDYVLLLHVNFKSRYDIDLTHLEIVRGDPPADIGNPPLLKFEFLNENLEPLRASNQWHPLWQFVNSPPIIIRPRYKTATTPNTTVDLSSQDSPSIDHPNSGANSLPIPSPTPRPIPIPNSTKEQLKIQKAAKGFFSVSIPKGSTKLSIFDIASENHLVKSIDITPAWIKYCNKVTDRNVCPINMESPDISLRISSPSGGSLKNTGGNIALNVEVTNLGSKPAKAPLFGKIKLLGTLMSASEFKRLQRSGGNIESSGATEIGRLDTLKPKESKIFSIEYPIADALPQQSYCIVVQVAKTSGEKRRDNNLACHPLRLATKN